MMQQLDDLGDMIHDQQDLRDRTFKQGQDERRRGAERGPQGKEGQKGQQGQQSQQGQQPGDSFGDLQQSQQALRDRLNKLLEELKNRGFGKSECCCH
jgi:hypothetical protein